MMLGGWPVQGVWIITSTSEMSGNASSGMWRRAQIPESTSRTVPVKTRKRFCAHQSIHREITLHTSRGVHAQLLGHDELAILFCEDCDLPGSAAFKLSRTFIETSALVAESDGYAHRCHAHCGHRRHEKRDVDFCSRDRRSARICEFHAEYVATLMWWGRIGTQFDTSLWSV